MARLADCASIFQLAFGLNAALPAVSFAFRRAHENITVRFSKEVQNADPEFKFNEWEMVQFRRFVKGSSTGLKFAQRIKVFPILAFGISVLLSFVGLIFGATMPDYALANRWVWTFALFSLVFSPALGLAYEWFLRFLEQAILLNWAESPEAAAETARYFKISLEGARVMADVEAKMKDVRRVQADLKKRTKALGARTTLRNYRHKLIQWVKYDAQ
jgi:hypothetical protein